MVMYKDIAAEIERQIDQGSLIGGARLATEPELAAQFDVHPMTAKKALSLLQRKGRIVRQRGRGSFVAGPAHGSVSVLLVGAMDTHQFRNEFVPLAAEAQRLGVRLHAYQPEAEGKTDVWRPRFEQALACTTWLIVNTDVWHRVADLLPPGFTRCILMGYAWPSVNVPYHSVFLDLGRAVECAVAHLVALGHRAIALLTPAERAGNPDLEKWFYPAFQAALARHGIAPGGRVLATPLPDDAPAIGPAIDEFLRRERVTAIVADADYRAKWIYESAARLGLSIPGDLSVVGLGDTPWSTMLSPALTTVHLNEEAAARIALALCQQGAVGDAVICYVVPRVVARDSSASPQGECPAG